MWNSIFILWYEDNLDLLINLLDMRSVSYRLATPNELSIAFDRLSDKVFQDVLEAMNISNSLLSSYKTLIEGTG